MSDFSKARIGDRVWDFRQGWGTICYNHIVLEGFPIAVNFDSGNHSIYTCEGRFCATDRNPSLFWDEIKFEEPPPPVRKVKRWISGFRSYTGRILLYGNDMEPKFYLSEEEARKPDSVFVAEVEVDENIYQY